MASVSSSQYFSRALKTESRSASGMSSNCMRAQAIIASPPPAMGSSPEPSPSSHTMSFLPGMSGYPGSMGLFPYHPFSFDKFSVMSSPKAELIASIDCNILAFLIILFEGYVRIPWNGKNEPLISVPAKCSVCSRETKDGIAVKHENAMLGFCTNRHYVQWWKTVCPALRPQLNQTLMPDGW